MIHHNDRRSQDTSYAYRAVQEAQGGMGKKGNCFDNAVVENFFPTRKRKQLLDHFFTCQKGQLQVFEYLEALNSWQRRHSTLIYKAPTEFKEIMGRYAVN